jgi:hypothetical protein
MLRTVYRQRVLAFRLLARLREFQRLTDRRFLEPLAAKKFYELINIQLVVRAPRGAEIVRCPGRASAI